MISPETPVITTVHGLQVVENGRIVMQGHDTPLDWIITPDEVIETQTPFPIPGGVNWDMIQADQWQNIPFLADLKERFTR